jgi:ATP-dependent helicase/nuclease subunit A
MADVWRKPPAGEVWRERAFEVVIEQDWITGIFDRVIVERDSTGRVVRAVVVDFKTDSVEPGEYETVAARYVQQLELYRKVVAVLTEAGIERVECWAIFTRAQKIVVVKPVVSQQ